MGVKKLPNRKYPSKYEWKPFPIDFVEKLCEEYGFKDSNYLKKEIEEVWLWYGAYVRYEIDKKTIPDQLEVLDELRKACSSLSKIIRGLGRPERSAINIYFGDEFNLDELENYLSVLTNFSEFTFRDIKGQQSPGGRPKEDAIKDLIIKLALVFEQGTGKKPKPYWNDLNRQYQGGALQFIHTVLIEMGEKKNLITLGKLIKKVLSNYDKGKNI